MGKGRHVFRGVCSGERGVPSCQPVFSLCDLTPAPWEENAFIKVLEALGVGAGEQDEQDGALWH